MKETFSPLPIHRQLGKKIQLLRVDRGWSQETLAELAGLHRNYIGHIERFEANSCLTNLQRLAGAFGLSVHELLDMGEI